MSILHGNKSIRVLILFVVASVWDFVTLFNMHLVSVDKTYILDAAFAPASHAHESTTRVMVNATTMGACVFVMDDRIKLLEFIAYHCKWRIVMILSYRIVTYLHQIVVKANTPFSSVR